MISVILTCYNAEAYIQRAIESIIKQTYTDWEIFIVDDASTDRTVGVIEDMWKRFGDNNRVLSVLSENEGHTAALNLALRKVKKFSKSNIIAWMDADDISEPTRFEEQLKCFKDNIGIVTTHSIAIDKEGKRIKDYYCDKAQRRTELEIKIHSETDWWVCGPSMMFKREVVEKIGGFDEECYYAQDFNFWLRAIEHFGWAKCGMELYRLRRHKSVRNNKKARERNWHKFAIKRSKECPIINL
jgi:glycosyltransferase involved in cell wall biosynthesis